MRSTALPSTAVHRAPPYRTEQDRRAGRERGSTAHGEIRRAAVPTRLGEALRSARRLHVVGRNARRPGHRLHRRTGVVVTVPVVLHRRLAGAVLDLLLGGSGGARDRGLTARRATRVAAERHVRAGVERLRAVRALPRTGARAEGE